MSGKEWLASQGHKIGELSDFGGDGTREVVEEEASAERVSVLQSVRVQQWWISHSGEDLKSWKNLKMQKQK